MTTATEPLVKMIARAARAGVDIRRGPGGALELAAPREFVYLGRALRRRESDVLKLYDWTHARTEDPLSCLLCGAPAILRETAEHRPCHKVCCDALLHPGEHLQGGDGDD